MGSQWAKSPEKQSVRVYFWKIKYLNQNAVWSEIPPFGIPAPDCLLAPKSRDNHNGNGPGGFPNTYNWTIPNDIQDNCALRLRYNISTGDVPTAATAELSMCQIKITSYGKVFCFFND